MDSMDCLRINLSTENPIELTDFLSSCFALANEYNNFAEGKGGGKLLIKEIRHGSIEIDLIDIAAIAASSVPLMVNVNIIADFFKHLKGVYDWIRNVDVQHGESVYSSRTLKNVQDILTPVAKDNSAQITIAPVIHGDVSAPIVINCNDSNFFQNKLQYEIKKRTEPKVERLEKCLLRWYQSRNVVSDTSGDKVIIEELSAKPIRAEFCDRSVKALFLAGKENLFKLIYIADIQVKRIQGVPKLVIIEAIEPLNDGDDEVNSEE